MVATEICAGMEPGFGQHRWDVRSFFDVSSRLTLTPTLSPCGGEGEIFKGGKFFRVKPLDHPKAVEFALNAVVIPVVVGVAGDEAVAADQVMRLNALHHMHR